MSEEKKIGIVVLLKFNKEFFELTPKKEAELHKAGAKIYKRWETIKLVCGYHAVGMGKFDYFEVWEVTDIGDWEASVEEWTRCWGKYVEYYEVYIGINDPSFNEATKDIPHFKELAKMSKEA